MLAIYDFISKIWFRRKNRRRDNQKNFVTLIVSIGIQNACHTSDALAEHMKNLRKKNAYNSSNTKVKLNVGHSL